MALEIHKARKQEWWPSGPQEAPYFRGQGWVGLAPCPHPLPTQELPLHTLSISRGTWCYVLVLSSSWGEGGGKGSPSGTPSLGLL